MKINFKQPRYIIPLLVLPFFCLFFYVYSNSAPKGHAEMPGDGLNGQVADISDQVRDRELAGKLDAYRDRYKSTDGYSGITPISEEVVSDTVLHSGYNDQEKRALDSIAESLRSRGNGFRSGSSSTTGYQGNSSKEVRSPAVAPVIHNNRTMSAEDRQVAKALADLAAARRSVDQADKSDRQMRQSSQDPMELFRKQMSYVDSISRQNDPAFQQESRVKAEATRSRELQAAADRNALRVQPVSHKGPEDGAPLQIKALTDQDITAYAGSRVRIRLLEDMRVGEVVIPKGNFLYAIVNGFSDQRIKLAITSVHYAGKILPVKLEVFDLDGLPGLYVPGSFFREFSKNIGGESIQGVSVSSASGQQFLMSTVDKLFQSTSSAISGLIKKNKAKVKYSTYVLLIDATTLK